MFRVDHTNRIVYVIVTTQIFKLSVIIGFILDQRQTSSRMDFRPNKLLQIKHQQPEKSCRVPYSPLLKTNTENTTKADPSDWNPSSYSQAIQNYRGQLQISSQQRFIKNIKDDHLKIVSLKKRGESDRNPTNREVHEAMKMLQAQIPNKQTGQLIKILYKSLVLPRQNTKLTQTEEQDQKLLNDFINSTSNIKPSSLQALQSINAREQSVKKKRQQPYFMYMPGKQRKFMDEDDQLRYKMRRIVARAYVNRDYGIAALNAELAVTKTKITIHRRKYKNIACSVVIEGFRRLQHFLKVDCKRGIKPLNRVQIRAMLSYLCNIRLNMDAKHCVTFFHFVQIIYGLANVSLVEEDAIEFYIAVLKALKKKIGEMQLDRVYQTENTVKEKKVAKAKNEDQLLWTSQFQAQFLNCYKKLHQHYKVKAFFRQKYPQKQHLYTVNSLRGRLNKILRMSLRKMNLFIKKMKTYRVEKLVELNDHKVKIMMRSPDALDVRILLIDIYLYDECDRRRLNRTIQAINEFITTRDRERLNQVIEAAPPIHSVSDMVQHNVAVSKNKLRESHRKYAEDQIFLKGSERNFHHIVSVSNGQNLHYYRKVDSDPLRNRIKIKSDVISYRKKGEDDQSVKQEEQSENEVVWLTSEEKIKSCEPEAESQSAQTGSKSSQRGEQSIKLGGQLFINPNREEDGVSPLQSKIREQMKKYMRSIYDEVSSYANEE